EEMQRRPALPPTGVVVIFGDLVEAELLVVVGTDPFGCVDGALFQRRIDIAAGDLLRNGAKLGKGLPSPSADPHFETVEVVDGIDLLAKPAAHLGAGVAAGDGVQFGFPAKLIE